MHGYTTEELEQYVSSVVLPERPSAARGESGTTARAQGDSWASGTVDASLVMRAGKYIDQMPSSIEGSGGSLSIWKATMACWGFGLDRESARRILDKYNERAEPPWSDWEIERKLDQVEGNCEYPLGYMLDKCGTVSTEFVDLPVTNPRQLETSIEVLSRDGLQDRVMGALARRVELGFNPAAGPLIAANCVLGGGLPAGAVSLLGAPPGQGKSSLGLGWAEHVARSGRPALYCSLEMSELDLYCRLTTLYTSQNWMAIRCGKDVEALRNSVKRSLAIPLYVATRQHVTSGIVLRAMVDELVERHGVAPFVVVDYLQIMVPVGKEAERFDIVARNSAEIRDMANETGAPVLCITAVNRQSYNILDKRSSKPDMSLVLQASKLSGVLEYDAECLMGLQLLEGADNDGNTYGWLCIAKNRSGGGRASLAVRYEGVSGNFFDAEEDDIQRAIAQACGEREGADADRIVSAIDRGVRAKSTDDLLRGAGVSIVKNRKTVAKLESDGILTRNNAGEWTLDKGEDHGMGRD